MIREVQELTDIPVAVMTNGSLLYRPEVREELLPANAVLPALDADNESLYLTLNRPSAEITFDRIVKGLVAFRRLFLGRLWVEVMLVKGLNDTEVALKKLAAVLRWINPEEVHLNLPVRPPSETWVEPSDAEGLMRAKAILGEIARVVSPVEGTFDLSGYDNVVDAVVAVITRHPMGEAELARTLDRWTPGEVAQTLTRLAESGKVQVVTRYGKRFYSAIGARYAVACPEWRPAQHLAGCGRPEQQDTPAVPNRRRKAAS
jgi:wyosine [tRNA(Phe)-imidazoG37] synthetase (radical SAM superfamily)